jgi:transposase-like protein
MFHHHLFGVERVDPDLRGVAFRLEVLEPRFESTVFGSLRGFFRWRLYTLQTTQTLIGFEHGVKPMSVLSKTYFHDEAAAFAHLESILWPEGPVCPHCASVSGKHYDLRKSRVGLRKCSDCRKQFTVKVGTVFESAHIPLNKMLQAVYLLCSSKKGISSHQLHRVLEITYKSAWFLSHRIREAMRSGDLAPMGGPGSIVEVDETFIGNKPGAPKKRGYGHKNAVLSLVDRESGKVRSLPIRLTHTPTRCSLCVESG